MGSRLTTESGRSFLFQLRWTLSELRLRRGRTFLTLAGVAIAAGLLASVSSFHEGYREALRRGIDQLGFEVLVTAKGCPYEAATMFLKGGNIPMYLEESTYRAIVDDPAVGGSTRLFLQMVSGEEGRQHLLLGVDEAFRDMKPWLSLQVGEWLESPDDLQAVLGYNVATETGAAPGDELRLEGITRPLRVVGILDRTGAQDDGTVFVPLRTAQRLFDRKERLTGVGIKIRDHGRMPDYLVSLYELPGVQVVTMSQAQTVIADLAGTARNLLAAMAGATALVASLALFNTVLMGLYDRRRDLAVLRALGASGGYIFRATLLESVVLAGGGALLGVLLAFAGAGTVEAFLRSLLPFTPEGRVLSPSFEDAALVFCGALVAGIVSAVYPAWRAAAVRPYQVIREAE